jgi:hypothetical protein
MKPLILTDVDDCLLSWIAGFRKYCTKVLGRKIVGLPGDWDMSGWLGLKDEVTNKGEIFRTATQQATQLVHDFNHGKWEFGILPPIADAQVFLPTLHRRGFEVVAITCCSHSEATITLRKANLYHVFGDIFQEVICQPLGTSKTKNLSRFKDRNVVAWVEDKPSAALEGHSLGYPSYLMRQDHNAQYDGKELKRVDSWLPLSEDLWDKV